MPKKPVDPSKLARIVLSLVLGAPIGYLFVSGFILNNLIPSGKPNVPDTFNWPSLITPALCGVVFLALWAVECKLKIVKGLWTRFTDMSTSYSVEEHVEEEAVEQRESRHSVKAREKELARLRAEGWQELHTRHDSLMLEWSKYETDISLMIDYPIMTDYTDPVIHKMIAAMQKIRTAQMKLEEDAGIDAHDSAFNEAVNEFELSFQAAERYARRYGQTRLDPREQRKLSAARSALNIILDGESPTFEVEAAYKSLRSSLKGIIDVPEKALMEIEALVRREIVAG